MDARRIDTLEEMSYKVQSGKMKGSEVEKEDWDAIREHEKMWRAFITPKGE